MSTETLTDAAHALAAKREQRLADIIVLLQAATGMSDQGVKNCLSENRLPHNATIAKKFAKALGIKPVESAKP